MIEPLSRVKEIAINVFLGSQLRGEVLKVTTDSNNPRVTHLLIGVENGGLRWVIRDTSSATYIPKQRFAERVRSRGLLFASFRNLDLEPFGGLFN